MEIREIVRLKKGVGGLEPPLNIGILLDREKAGKEHIAKVFTVKGELKVRTDSLKEPTGRRYDGDKVDARAMERALREAALTEAAENALRLDPQNILDRVDPRDLWSSVIKALEERMSFGRPLPSGSESPLLAPLAFSPEEIGRMHFDPFLPDRRQVNAVAKVLSACDPVQAPYFLMVEIERRPHYAPYTSEAMRAVEEAVTRLKDLRSELIILEEVPSETPGDHIRKVARLRYDDISLASLDDAKRGELERLCAQAIAYLENGRWPVSTTPLRHSRLQPAPPFSLGGTPVKELGKFSLEGFVLNFFLDLSQSRRREPASNIIEVLLKLKMLTWREASDLVVDHKIASGAQKFHREFPPHVIAASGLLPDSVRERDLSGRLDLRHLETYTIDPPDAKDFDDAVSIVAGPNGYLVWVHIADVSHYVRPFDLIDSEARFRATSVYLPTGVLPMLPPKLSEDLCSLKERLPRLSVSTVMELDLELNLLSYGHHCSVIEVTRNLDYDQVEAWIEEGREPFSTLNKVAEGLSRKFGRLHLETPERRVRFPGENSISVTVKRPTRATHLIEELMVLCNECAARTIEKSGHTTAFRVHPLPDRTSIDKFNGGCRALGLPFQIERDWGPPETKDGAPPGEADGLLAALLSGGKVSIGGLSGSGLPGPMKDGVPQPIQNPIDPVEMGRAVDSYNTVLERMASTTDIRTRDLLNMRLLRTLPRAFYSDSNLGHFGLRSLCYCHFTSPIRRYPDTLAHRAIKALISIAGECDPSPPEAPSSEEIEGMIEVVNEQSGSAEDWERTMVDAALATRIAMDQGSRGALHECTLVSLTPSTAFFLLDDGVTEGRVPLSTMSKFRLSIDEEESRIVLTNQDNPDIEPGSDLFKELLKAGGEGLTFLKLGDRVACGIHSVSIAEGRVDLYLSNR